MDSVDKQIVAELQRKEKEFKYVFDCRGVEAEAGDMSGQQRQSFKQFEFVIADDDLLYCIDLPTLKSRERTRLALRLCLPSGLREDVLRQAHSGVLSGHPGITRMYEYLRRIVWWPSMIKDIVRVIMSCPICQRTKAKPQILPTQPMKVLMGPWRMIGIDIVGPLPISSSGNMYILVIVDYFTRYGEGWPMADTETVTIIRILIDVIICRYGLMEVMVSDRGTPFVSVIAEHLFKALGIKHHKSAAYHPQANGLVERFIQNVKNVLKRWGGEQRGDWDILLPRALFSLNTLIHSLTGETAFYANHGYNAKTITDLMLGRRSESGDEVDIHQYSKEIRDNLRDVHARIAAILTEVNEQRAEVVDDSMPRFKIGDRVLVYDPTSKKGEPSKLKKRWKGPYVVMEQLSPVTYSLALDGLIKTVHAERMKLYHDEADVSVGSSQQLIEISAEVDALATVQQQLIARKVAKEKELQEVRLTLAVEESAAAAAASSDVDTAEMRAVTVADAVSVDLN